MEVVIQMELFPKTNRQDIQVAKSLLNRYLRMRKTSELLLQREDITDKERQVAEEYKKKADAIELSVRMIMDDEVRRVMEYRFIKGFPRWGTVLHFSNITDRSVDRRIDRGIESVAETLKLIEII